MVTVTLELDVTLPEDTPAETEQEAANAAYEIIHSAPAFDAIDAEELASHTTVSGVDGI